MSRDIFLINKNTYYKLTRVKMPTKFKPSEVLVDRATKKKSIKHHYIKQISQDELFKTLNNESTSKKLKQKVRHELRRRGVKIVTTRKTEGIC